MLDNDNQKKKTSFISMSSHCRRENVWSVELRKLKGVAIGAVSIESVLLKKKTQKNVDAGIG